MLDKIIANNNKASLWKSFTFFCLKHLKPSVSKAAKIKTTLRVGFDFGKSSDNIFNIITTRAWSRAKKVNIITLYA